MARLEAVQTAEIDDETATRIKAETAERLRSAQQMQQRATGMLLAAVSALSQRFVIALAALFTLVTVASAFYLWMEALPEISTLKIIGCSIYSGFVLALNWRRQ